MRRARRAVDSQGRQTIAPPGRTERALLLGVDTLVGRLMAAEGRGLSE
jgi:hypothetical protein